MALCVFDCTCFVRDLSPGLDKLFSQSIKYVFVRYSRTQKGYECYTSTNKKHFVSADVMFFESIPYFSPQGPVTLSESIPLPPSVPLSVLAPVPDVSLSVSLTDTTELPAPNPLRDFRYVHTHRPKVPASGWLLSSGRSSSSAIL